MNGYLVLESGEAFVGRWRGGVPQAGEIVFNTSHSGYEEIATDPSYHNQIMMMSAPMMGNYGVDVNDWESNRFWIKGFMALQVQNSDRDRSWLNRLLEREIPVIDEINTRKAVLKLRESGTTWGALVPAESEEEAHEKAVALIKEVQAEDKDWAYFASRKEAQFLKGENSDGPKVVVMDFGCKNNILRELGQRCRELVVVNSRASVEDIMRHEPEGLFLSNGPGDPGDVEQAPEVIAELIGKLPIFGICMGHQLLARALGGKTFKLKFGHRGSNHPIQDKMLERIYITSQNHGYAVEMDSLPKDVEVTHVNLNDDTVSGLRSPNKMCFSVQFHPECHPGPRDALALFDKFIDLIRKREF